jgi:hypothetical protein
VKLTYAGQQFVRRVRIALDQIGLGRSGSALDAA